MNIKSLLEIMATAMDREEKGRLFYLEAANKTSNTKGKRMFQWLAGGEKKHYEKISQQREELDRGGQWQKFTPTQPPLTPTEFPPTPEATGEVTPTSGELDALQMGIKAEKEAITLYSQALALATAPEAKTLFSRLVEEEKGHLELLEDEYEWLRQSGMYFTLHRFTMPG